MSRYRREIDTQCCNAWMHGIRTINGQYPDDNRDFDINAGSGIRIEPATGGITIINDSAASSFVEGDNIEITPSGDDLVIGLVSDPHVSGNLEVDGTTTLNDTLQVNADIIQNGAAYETHAEKVYTTNDYIITRDGAVSALSAGDYSGFQVKKYDGTNDGRLVIDNAGVARVGDVGDEQPLMTRDETNDMVSGDLIRWDGVNEKAITSSDDDVKSYSIECMDNTGSSYTTLQSWSNLNLGTVTGDSGFFTVGTNSITIKKKGKYVLTMSVIGNTDATNIPVYFGIEAGGTRTQTSEVGPSHTRHQGTLARVVQLNVGDVVKFQYYINSGSSVTLTLFTYGGGLCAGIGYLGA